MTTVLERCQLDAKHFVFQLAYGLGFYRILKAINNIEDKRLTVVTYHRVTDRKVEQIEDSLRNLFVNVETFERQVLFFKKNYTITSIEGLCDLIGRGQVPTDLMLITFDDGYKDFRQHAYPILKKHGIPAAIFIVPDKIGNAKGFSFWWDEMYHYMTSLMKREISDPAFNLPEDIGALFAQFKNNSKVMLDNIFDTCSESQIEGILKTISGYLGEGGRVDVDRNAMLTWKEIDEISDLVEIGSHTMRHKNMKYLTDEELYDEIHRSRKVIAEKTNKKVVAFSYPNGFYTENIARHVRDAGYRFAFTTDKGINDLRDPYHIKRINLWERTSSVQAKPFSKGKLSLKMVGL